jgi:tol-pal system protein YbgF
MLNVPQEAMNSSRKGGHVGWLALAATVYAASLLNVGCAHEAAQDKQLTQLRDALSRDEQDHDKKEPAIPAADDPLIDPRKDPDAKLAPQRPGADPQKELRIVQLSKAVGEPGDAPSSEDPEDATPRPSIRVAGTPSPVGRAPRGRGAKDQVSTSFPDDGAAAAGPSTPAAAGPEARAAYDAARSLMTQRKYKEALDGFTAFLVKWPDHPMADNAMFWRGDCYYSLGDFPHAEQELAGALARFPQGIKAPDTLLKLGMAEDKLGQPDKARAYYEKLQKEFPKSEAARRIPSSGGSGPKGPKENR